MVVMYGMAMGPGTIGGPNVDAGQMVWIPFFLADFPWSMEFDRHTYSSGALALAIYALVVGLPWIAYGSLLSKLAAWLNAKTISR